MYTAAMYACAHIHAYAIRAHTWTQLQSHRQAFTCISMETDLKKYASFDMWLWSFSPLKMTQSVSSAMDLGLGLG